MQARTLGTWIRTPLLLLAVVELAVLYSSLYVAGIVAYGSLSAFLDLHGSVLLTATLISASSLVSLVAMGLYQLHQRFYFQDAVLRVLAGLVAAYLFVAIVFYVFPSAEVSRNVANLSFAYSLTLLLGIRYFFVRTIDRNVFRRRTMIYGAGERAATLFDLRRSADRRGFKVVGRMAAPGDTVVGDRSEVLMTNGKTITDWAKERGAEEIVIAMDERRGNLPVRDLLDARLDGIDVIDLLEFFERETGKIRIDLVNPGWLIFSPGFRTTKFRKVSERITDLLVGATIFLLAWPIMLLCAVAIKLEDGISAPVIYKQRRVGMGNRVFHVFKFRSMSVDAEKDGKAVWASKNDNRVTNVGNYLRKLRLDELPQIFNVLRGEMSLVGPRPERPEFVEELQKKIPYYGERHAAKPGITGWAQLRYSYGASEEDAAEKLQYDLYYIKNQSLMLDLLIILQTVEVVLWGKGAR